MSRKPIIIPQMEGLCSRQAHADLPPNCVERELGRDGFFGPASHMIHPQPPTRWLSWEGPLRPRAFDGLALNSTPESQSPWEAACLMHNAHCRLRLWTCTTSMDHLVRNADGDDLLFVHAGAADFYCDYGHLEIEAGDYLLIPRGTLWRLEVCAPVCLLMIEATHNRYQLPDRGMLGEHAFFDPAMLDRPRLDEAFLAQQNNASASQPWAVRIKRLNKISTVRYPDNPLDALGWHGSLYPVRINVRDLRPLNSHRYHLPPSVHTTFVADRFVVCTFVPRPFETDPAAIKVPFFHNNDDFDEVIFYHAGNFFSRDHIQPGWLSYHPCGFTHGPHPKALSRMLHQPQASTDEYAVMIDTRDALEISPTLEFAEWQDYHRSWQSK